MTDAAVILAGGRSRRLGTPKQSVVIDGATLLERTVTACIDFATIVVVGPRSPLLPERVIQVREEPPFGGPVAAIFAALPALKSAGSTSVLVLACDMPRVSELVSAVPSLNDEVDAFISRDRGRIQPLAGRYRMSALEDAITRSPIRGASMFTLLAGLECTTFDMPEGCADDVDTSADLAAWATS